MSTLPTVALGYGHGAKAPLKLRWTFLVILSPFPIPQSAEGTTP